MDLYIQKYMSFVAAVDCGSFTKAAEKLNYSQSGISRMIADLEKEWQVTLLERGKNGVHLTSDGMKLLPHARALISEFEKMQMAVDDLHGVQSGMIRIGTISSIATYWLPDIILEFQKKYPNIEYELLLGHYKEIEDWIDSGRVDIGFLRLPVHKEFETIPLAMDKLLAVLPADHPLADCDKFPLHALEEDPFILLERGQKEEISEIFEKNHLTPNIKFTTVDDYAVMSMVEKGLGIGILPELILLKKPFHIVTKELEVPAYRTLGAALRSKKSASLAVKRFLEYTENMLSESKID